MLKVIDSKEKLERIGLKCLDIIDSSDGLIEEDVYCLLEEDHSENSVEGIIPNIFVECYINHSGEIALCQYPECVSLSAIMKLIYDLTKNNLLVWEEEKRMYVNPFAIGFLLGFIAAIAGIVALGLYLNKKK